MRASLINAEVAKLKKVIAQQGQEVTFSRLPLNQYKNPDPNGTPTVIKASGVFHQSQSYVTVTNTTDSKVLKKQTPMFLGLWDDLSGLVLNDTATIANINYKVIDVTNVSDLSIAGDVSLEVVK